MSNQKIITSLRPILYKAKIRHLLAGTTENQGLHFSQNKTALYQKHMLAYFRLNNNICAYDMFVAMTKTRVIITLIWKVLITLDMFNEIEPNNCHKHQKYTE